MICDKVRGTIAAIRRAFPFSTANQRDFLSPVPDLKNVNESVRAYQRPRDFFNSEYYLKLHDRADYRNCPAQLRLFVWRYMRALRARGLPFYVHTCYRTPEEQAKLKKRGFSKTASGPHQRGAAVDIVSAIDHWEIPEDLWYYVGTLGEQIAADTFFGNGIDDKPQKIEWGGRFKGLYDPAHWQLRDWNRRTVADREADPVRLLPYSDQMRFG